MTDVIPGAAEDPAGTARRMRAIAAALTAAGLTTHLHDTSGVLDITPRCTGLAARKPK